MFLWPPSSPLFPTRRSSDLSAGRGKLRPIDADLNHIPDAAMTAAVAALFADGPSTLRNIASWRVKETDRSEEHTSELQSRRDLVCRLLLEKKKIKYIIIYSF